MGRGKAAYILKVISDLNGTELKNKITSRINNNHIIESGNKKNRKGFRNLNINTENLPIEVQPHYFIDNSHSNLRAVYQEYQEDVDRYTGDVQYFPNYLDLLYDYNKRVLIVFSSNPVERDKILTFFNNAQGGLGFQQPRYSGRNVESFFRWLIANSKDGRDKFPPSCKLLNIEGAKVTRLDRSLRHSTSEIANLKSSGYLIDDHLYEQVVDEGIREHIKCIFMHSRLAFKTAIYNNGKINLSSRPPNIEDIKYFSLFPIIFEEMENLYDYYLQDIGEVN